ncbi:YegP family protein [Salinimicrobium xinjiangense]|uniref:YegP family protein n=1 Tax=Salinimicrobium xinjiangense TaxID=438596 RepID=UPI0003FF3682|nr:YegP family protein [Salinimicrobium xinjiangense]
MSNFEIKKDKADEFRFNLKAGNGQIILSSEGYKAKPSCMNGIESVRTNSQSDERFERKQTSSGHKFNLKSTNGQVVGTSEIYTTTAAMENGISSVKKNAPAATVDDQS